MADVSTLQPVILPDISAGAEPRSYWSTVGERLVHDRITLAVGAVLLCVILLAIFAPWAATHDPLQGSVMRRLKPIGTPGFFLGTDETGRDIWSRLVYGGRLSLICGVTPVALATLIGGTLGLVAGIGGRVVNMAIMRVVDVFYAFPSVLLAIAICGVIGAGIGNTILSLMVVFTPPIVRVTESLTAQVKNRDFVEAARASAAPLHAIISHQILPNVLGGMLVYATSLVGIGIISLGRAFVSWARRDSAEPGMGADAQRPAPGDFRQPDSRRVAGNRYRHHLAVFQPAERRVAQRDGH